MSHGMKHLEVRICPQCNTEFEAYPSSKKRFCSKHCSGIFHSNLLDWRKNNPDYQNGENNPGWKGGTARSTINRRARKALTEANINQNICQQCGRESPLYRFNVHHKDGDQQNNLVENLEVLCPTCHNSGSPLARHSRELDEHGRFSRGITFTES
jgi:endogenous inhibitor of DNA gyrase (YacG/DUF329 family)